VPKTKEIRSTTRTNDGARLEAEAECEEVIDSG